MARHTLVKQQALHVTPSSASVPTAPPPPILALSCRCSRGTKDQDLVAKRQQKQPKVGAGAEEQPHWQENQNSAPVRCAQGRASVILVCKGDN